MNSIQVLQITKEVIIEVKNEMKDYRPEIEIATQFAAIRMFQRLDKIYKFKTLQ